MKPYTRIWETDRVVWWWEFEYWRVAVWPHVTKALWLSGWRQVTLDGWYWGHGSSWCTPWTQRMRHWTRERGVHFIARAEWRKLYERAPVFGYRPKPAA